MQYEYTFKIEKDWKWIKFPKLIKKFKYIFYIKKHPNNQVMSEVKDSFWFVLKPVTEAEAFIIPLYAHIYWSIIWMNGRATLI